MDSGYDDKFGVKPEDVLGQSQKEGYYYPERAMAAKKAGFNPLAEAAPLFQSRKQNKGQAYDPYGDAMAAQAKGQNKEPSPFARDAEFYANAAEDYGAAQALTSSKDGRAIFQMYDPYDLDNGFAEDKKTKKTSTWMIVPKGSRQVPTPEGVKDLPMHALARQYGVTNVPFKAGGEEADKFRGLISDSQLLLGNLNKLEEIYNQNAILTGFGYSEASTEARGLEAKITQDFMRVMSGTKGLGGNVSERDLSFAMSMTPQRATNWVTRFKGNELALIKKVRAMTKEKLKSSAQANGLDFLEQDSNGGDPSRQESYENNSITLE
jgi:hypothetical protein